MDVQEAGAASDPPRSRHPIVAESRAADVFLQDENGRVVFIPKGWGHAFGDRFPDDESPSIYGYQGNEAVDGWRPGQPLVTADAARWHTLTDLERLPRLTREQAEQADPKLFAAVAALNRPASDAAARAGARAERVPADGDGSRPK